jgi:predicted transposase/invertase (TIGR01784 family)
MISILDFEIFPDPDLVHRSTIYDIHKKEKINNPFNFTFIELPKLKDLENISGNTGKWSYLFKYLNQINTLPDFLQEDKFTRLLSFAETSKYSKEEYQQYLKEMKNDWVKYAEEQYNKSQIEEDSKKGMEQGVLQNKRKIVKKLLDCGVKLEDFIKISGLSEDEIISLQ